MRLVKFFTLCLMCLFISSAITAQEKSTYSSGEFFPKKGDIGASILIDGLIDNIKLTSNNNQYGQNILFVKYYLEDDLALRLGFGFTLDAYKREKADSMGLSLIEVDSTSSRYFINTSFGIEKHLNPSKRLDPFIFAQLDLTFIGKTKIEAETREISTAGVSSLNRTIKRDGGIAFGLQVGGGMNYFLTERFSIGTELALRFQVVSEGGTISDNEIFTPIGGSSVSDISSSEDRITTTELNVSPNALINLSYYF